MQGGVIQAGKNFIPRLRNIANGDTLTNRAAVKPKTLEDVQTEQMAQAIEEAEQANTDSTRVTESGRTTLKPKGDENENNSEEHKD